MVRLRKSPPPRLVAWAAAGPDPLTCSWFFLLVAAAESMPPRVDPNQLVGAARSAAAEAGLPAPGDRRERLAIIAAMRLLNERGVIEKLEGELDGFIHDENAPVLLAVHHTRLIPRDRHPGVADPAADPAAWLCEVTAEPDPARRTRRRLVDDTVVHAADWMKAKRTGCRAG